jgi:hypothetical protein
MKVMLKKGARIKGDVEQIHREIESIREKNGGEITPEKLVKAAWRKSSPLHDEFDWDDKAAAHKWRLDKARYILRSIEVIREPTQPETRAYEITRSEDDGEPVEVCYKTIDDILANEEDRKAMIERGRKSLISWCDKYAVLDELSDTVNSVRRLAGKIEKRE